MFIFFFGNRLPPFLRRFIIGCTLASLCLLWLIVQFRMGFLFNLSFLIVPLVGAWFAFRDPMRRNKSTARFERRNEPDLGRNIDDISRLEALRAREAADRAVRLAGHDPEGMRVRLEDIGLMVYRGGTRPELILRDTSLSADATHIRPFIRLHSPLAQTANQPITFELSDADGRALFQSAETYPIQPGDNLVTPPTWLPLFNITAAGRWSLRVLLGATPLALHPFAWRRVPTVKVRKAEDVTLYADGEIAVNPKATERLSAQPLSLEQLLADQQNSTDSLEQSLHAPKTKSAKSG